MAFPDLAANVIYSVLCLVPGFISLQTMAYTTNRKPDSDLELSIWSLLGSGVALSALYFLYVIGIGITTGKFVLVHSLELGWVDLLVIYPALIFVSIVLGYAGALIHGRMFGAPSSTRPETSN